MTELLILITISFIVGFIVGKIQSFFHIRKLIYDFCRDQGIDIDKELKKVEEKEKFNISKPHEFSIEKYGDMLYLFDNNHNKFLCQGSDLQDLINHVNNLKYIDEATIIFNDQLLFFKNGKLTE